MTVTVNLFRLHTGISEKEQNSSN